MAFAKWFRSIFSGKNEVNSEKANLRSKSYFRLAEKQRELAQHASDVWKKFEGKLDNLSQKVRLLSKSGSIKDKVIHEQQVLDIALFRLETSLKETRDLQRELSEWERLAKSDKGKVDVNHPSLRLAIVKSELEIRTAIDSGILDKTTELNSFTTGKSSKFNEIKNSVSNTFEIEVENQKPYRIVKVSTNYGNVSPHNPEGLVKTIRHVSMELAQETQKKHKNKCEIVDFLHQLKDLHAALRLTDRTTGKVRDRLEITDGFRHVFTHH